MKTQVTATIFAYGVVTIFAVLLLLYTTGVGFFILDQFGYRITVKIPADFRGACVLRPRPGSPTFKVGWRRYTYVVSDQGICYANSLVPFENPKTLDVYWGDWGPCKRGFADPQERYDEQIRIYVSTRNNCIWYIIGTFDEALAFDKKNNEERMKSLGRRVPGSDLPKPELARPYR